MKSMDMTLEGVIDMFIDLSLVDYLPMKQIKLRWKLFVAIYRLLKRGTIKELDLP